MARLPRWLRVRYWRPRRQGERTVTVTIAADVSQFLAGMEAASKAAADMQAHFGRMADAVIAFARKIEVYRAGQRSKYWMRGGLDPIYADPDARDTYSIELLNMELWGPEMAGAFLEGWFDTYGDDGRPPYIRHLTMPDDTRIECAA